MKKKIKQYGLLIRFISTFLVVYVVLSLLYNYYLTVSQAGSFYPDFFTNISAKGAKAVLEFAGYNVSLLNHESKPFIHLILEGQYIGRVIEGCNAVSVIILFVTFVISFSSTYRKTGLYVIAGSLIIYVINILRIAILVVGVYYFPKYTDVLHSVVFPGIIYGIVFLLWLLWIYKFSGLNKRND